MGGRRRLATQNSCAFWRSGGECCSLFVQSRLWGERRGDVGTVLYHRVSAAEKHRPRVAPQQNASPLLGLGSYRICHGTLYVAEIFGGCSHTTHTQPPFWEGRPGHCFRVPEGSGFVKRVVASMLVSLGSGSQSKMRGSRGGWCA